MSITYSSAAPATRARTTYTVVLCLLVALGPCTIDLYLPALPVLQSELAASPAAVQLTLTAATVGFAAGQLVVGQWSDSAGRRRPLLWATGLHVIASVGVAAAPGIEWLLAFRVLQGAGAAGSAVVTIAIVRDLFEGSAFVTVLARLALVGGLAPVVAPLVGSQLVELVSWRGLFVCVAAYGMVALGLVALLLRETLPAHRRVPYLRGLKARYRVLLGDPVFVGVALIGGCLVSGVFCYMSSSSFVLQRTYGLDARGYGLVSALGAIAFVAGTQVAARLLRWTGPGRLLAVSLPALATAGFSVAIVEAMGLGLRGIVAAAVVFLLCAGLSVPSLSVIALSRHRETAGTAAALLGAANFGLAGVTSPIVGTIGIDTAAPMGTVMGLIAVAAVLALVTLVRPWRQAAVEA